MFPQRELSFKMRLKFSKALDVERGVAQTSRFRSLRLFFLHPEEPQSVTEKPTLRKPR